MSSVLFCVESKCFPLKLTTVSTRFSVHISFTWWLFKRTLCRHNHGLWLAFWLCLQKFALWICLLSACRLQRWKTFFSSSLQHPPLPSRPHFFPISYHTKSAWRGMQILNLVSPNPRVKSSQILGYHKKLRCSAASKIIWFKVIYVFGGERRFSW